MLRSLVMKKARKQTRARIEISIRRQHKLFQRRHMHKIMRILLPQRVLGIAPGRCSRCKASAICALRRPIDIFYCKHCNERRVRFSNPTAWVDGTQRCPGREATMLVCLECLNMLKRSYARRARRTRTPTPSAKHSRTRGRNATKNSLTTTTIGR